MKKEWDATRARAIYQDRVALREERRSKSRGTSPLMSSEEEEDEEEESEYEDEDEEEEDVKGKGRAKKK